MKIFKRFPFVRFLSFTSSIVGLVLIWSDHPRGANLFVSSLFCLVMATGFSVAFCLDDRPGP